MLPPQVSAEPQLAGREAAQVAFVEPQPGLAGLEAEPAKPKDVRLPPALWVTGLAAVIGAVLYFFTGRRVTR